MVFCSFFAHMDSEVFLSLLDCWCCTFFIVRPFVDSFDCCSGVVVLYFSLIRTKGCFALPHFAAFVILSEIFVFSRLDSLISHSAQSDFKQNLLDKAIPNEQSQYKKTKWEIDTGFFKQICSKKQFKKNAVSIKN